MAWGVFKKIKNAFSKVGNFVKDKVIKPIINTGKKVAKPLINTAVDLAPVIGAGVSTAYTGNPAMGMAIGSTVKTVGNRIGLGYG